MLIKRFLRLFLNANVSPNRFTLSAINSFGQHSRFYYRNVHASANIVSVPESGTPDPQDIQKNYSFREYIQNNYNFKNPVKEITNLNFPLVKYDSLKLLVKLKDNFQNDSLWREMLDCFSKEVSTFDVEDFMKIVALASDVGLSRGNQQFFSEFKAALDNELKARKLALDDFLEILFVFKHTLFIGKPLKKFRFYLKLNRKLLKLHRFEPLQVTHIFYYLEELNETSKQVNRFPVLKYVKENLSKFNGTEIGIIFAALYRAKLFIVDVELVQKISDKVLLEIESMSSLELFYISKFLMSCSAVQHNEAILNLQEKLIPYISKFNARSIIYALLANYPYSLHKSFWSEAVEKVKTELKTLQVSDIERLVRVTTAFKVESKELLQLAVEAVEENQDLDKSNPHLINFCRHLVIHKVYPKKLLSKVLSKDFIDNMLSRSFAKEIMAWAFLNYSLQIDKPEYQCACLNEDQDKKIRKKLFVQLSLQKPAICHIKARVKLHKCLAAIYGSKEVVDLICLPHFDRGLVMRFDENLNATPVPMDVKNKSKRLTKAPLDQHIWICINALYDSPKNLDPIQETYIRHLTAVGYKPVLVPETEFYHYFNLGTEELNKYLKGVIEAALQEISEEKKKPK